MIKVNGFWVPENDKHIEDWKSGSSFTQNKCLDKFIKIANPFKSSTSKI